MKIIGNGSVFRVYDDSMETYEILPPATYAIRFGMMQGFFLEKKENMNVGEEKIYGRHNEKAEKVIRGFNISNRNFGVILSGEKGIGKSLFARILSDRVISNGMPVLIVDENYDGIPDFVESIHQPVMVLFDEFEKIFNKKESQEKLLSMFDGTSNGRKLYVITCNNIRDLSDYVVNRPGRFHYNFQFDYPTGDEIVEYLSDKLADEYKYNIPDVVSFSGMAYLNYDCLRAIAFELNTGIPFSEAMSDLNIIHIDREKYNVYVYAKNGMIATAKNVSLDMFNDGSPRINIYTSAGCIGDVNIDIVNMQYSSVAGAYEISGVYADPYLWTRDSDEMDKDPSSVERDAEAIEKAGIDKIIVRIAGKHNNTHYTL